VRSLLIFPSDNLNFIDKAAKSNADVLIFDLEDSVDLKRKHIARRNLSKINKLVSKKEVFVRVNSNLAEFRKDIDSTIKKKISGFLLTKCEESKFINKQISIIKKIFRSNFKLILLIETPIGVMNLPKILCKENLPYIHGLMFGHEDFSTNLINYLNEDNNIYNFYRNYILLNAKAKNIFTFDSPFLEIKSKNMIKKYFKNSFEKGFNGSLIIHPNQINIANACYTPSKKDYNFASKVIKFSTKSKSIFMFKGKFIGPPILKRMQKIVMQYNKIKRLYDKN
jgi:citrate lyase subunit beta/citryl-CoA lyase